MTKLDRIGKLPPRYRFLLNEYVDQRFSRCPGCGEKTGQRKLPLLIHVEPMNMVALNKTCRYCARCDILIAHHDELEEILSNMFDVRVPMKFDRDYFVLGTIDRKNWRDGLEKTVTVDESLKRLHGFKAYLDVECTGGWQPSRRAP